MTPEQLTRLNNLENLLQSLLRVEDVSFIQNINRRAGTGIKSGVSSAATSITRSVNEVGTNTYNVAVAPDKKRKIVLEDGSVEYIGTYNT